MIKDLENKSFVSNRIKKQIISTICSNTINSFIIGGSKGLGKKNFIFKLCKFMLCHFELNDEISSEIFEVNQYCLDKTNINKSYYLFENNSHPDFFYLCKEESGDEKKIPIEKVRNLKSFFYKTFSVSKVKIAIIDTVEDLSLNSLNLLLKTIEELPQKSYIFIISNNPINIIETIKSRCAFFYVNSLSKKEFDDFIYKNYKDKSDQEILFLKNMSFGSPKNASKIIKNNIYSLYEHILDDLIKSKSFLNLSETVLNKLNSKENNFTLDVLNLIINDLIIKTVFYNEYKNFLGSTLNKEKELILEISNNYKPDKLLDLNSQIYKNMHFANLLNLNKSDVLIDSFKDFCGI